jgi:hypothetical protein
MNALGSRVDGSGKPLGSLLFFLRVEKTTIFGYSSFVFGYNLLFK